MKKYKKIALGGTFDHFHIGHQHFLMAAGELADSLVIGVTTPKMTSQKVYPELIESHDERIASVKAFTKNLFLDIQVVPLNDPYGPTLEGSTVEALIATTDTEAGAKAINSKRKELGLAELPIHLSELQSDSQGGIISSERVRAGEISRDGTVYASALEQTFKITDQQRKYFSKPQGQMVSKPTAGTKVCAVGDFTLTNFITNNWHYDLGLYDQKIQRQSYPAVELDEVEPDLKTINPAGSITKELVTALTTALSSKQKHILVDGEEDLAAVALLLLLPLQSHIYYGQPNQGMIEIVLTEERKDKVFKILTELL